MRIKLRTLVTLCLATSAWPGHAASDAPTPPTNRATADVQHVLHFKGRVDGSERITIDTQRAVWTHRSWHWPREAVLVNGVRWMPRDRRPLLNVGATRFLPAGFVPRTATLERIHGRDVVVVEQGPNSFIVHVNDTPSDAAFYEFKVFLRGGVAGRSRREPITHGKGPNLRIVADIDGSDQLHLNASGARWVHRHWAWPTSVRMNDVAWSPQGSQTLENRGETRFLDKRVDFSTAVLRVNRGRDTAVLERTKSGLIVHFADSPNGRSTYDLTLSFQR